ncbi:MAG: hypothetical protein WC716_02690 [Chitinophagaceae bacterium]
MFAPLSQHVLKFLLCFRIIGTICSGFFHPAKEVIVLDKRNDTSAAVGRVRSGFLNKEQSLKTGNPLSVSLSNYYTALSQGKTPEVQQLVVVIYTFLAYEGKPDYAYRNAHFKYAADYLISAGGPHYRHLGYIDTVISVEGMEVSKKIFPLMSSRRDLS